MDDKQSGNGSRPGLRVGVIAGSTRPVRKATVVAEWICADPIPSLELVLIDLADVGLPLLCEPAPAASGQYDQPATRSWSRLVAEFDAFVLVTPEYNHSTSAALKNALDHLYREWQDKPVAFVGYGLDGGTRAVEHLRAITAELGMAGVGPQVSIDLRADYAAGRLEPRSFQPAARGRMLGQLAVWATALRAARLRSASPNGPGRPELDDPAARAAAVSAVHEFVAGLQDGIDGGSGDVYDRQFASDVLWGNPYGGTLSGYQPLNAAHRALMAAGVAPPSRYQVVQLLTPVPGVVIAHVRRNDLRPDEAARFSEMAMYVLVERGGQWWLAAGQNTPVAERPQDAAAVRPGRR
jgi:NAD(P)H-dependent FMN reductase